ncbi:MAG: signal peptide peptidase SppA [Candidatus Andeanibacterium colombiense]|uniref:Signal peptide peptidase SppA n=1 Tax=Candidatus Andeanibacterium colombiense TaxID=3121345 RepID=A0AAJ6BP51_9SPHN|nr:MAG: signal peptide peptidase SppA [Sphingomonadaceae bacterium]
MKFAGKVWRLLVGIKDGLSLLLLLAFFSLLFGLLSARPSPGQVHDGALYLQLDGSVVEEASAIDPLNALISRELPASEYPARDLVAALDAAAADSRIKAVVLDLSTFTGGAHIHMQEIGAALDRVRAAKKPVLTFALAYTDDSVLLAAHSTEAWVDPLGGAMVRGPGGNRQYYKALLDYLKVDAHVFRVGTYKSAVEPYMRSDMSPAAREDAGELYTSVWNAYKADIHKARPKIDLDAITSDPAAWLQASHGNTAEAAQAAGIVDRIGDWDTFGERVAKLVGDDPWDNSPGNFAHTDLEPWLAANKPAKTGKAIGVITIAGEISDGDAGPGEAGGDRIAKLLDDALTDDLAALVVRVDSPGGTITGSEAIRRAILRQKARGIPVVVSMGNYAASGGYWVSTPADRIFAEPETITGSIGVYGVLPTFERAAAFWGVGNDGVKTTPLSGQPDVIGGLTPETEQVLQMTVEHEYNVFLGLVAKSRGKTPQQIDAIGQGRVWTGGMARQNGLVDQFGDLHDAIAYAAQKAGLTPGKYHAKYLGSAANPYASLIEKLMGRNTEAHSARAHDMFAQLALAEQDRGWRLAHDMRRLLGANGAQAYCLECSDGPVRKDPQAAGGVLALFGWLGPS